MDLQKIVAKNIREIRERRKLTLDSAAKLTGVSRSMLAQIEKGDANPTISVLWKIAKGYKVSFTTLINPPESAPLVIRKDHVPPLVEDDGKYINYPLFPFQTEKHFETYRIEILPGGSLEAQPHMAGIEEYITVFGGTVEITVDGDSFVLNDGDSLRFRADLPHTYRNPGEETTWLSMLIYYAEG